jgi:hypothetical protein
MGKFVKGKKQGTEVVCVPKKTNRAGPGRPESLQNWRRHSRLAPRLTIHPTVHF